MPWFSTTRTSTTYCPGFGEDVAEALVPHDLAARSQAVDPLVADPQVDDLFPVPGQDPALDAVPVIGAGRCPR